MAKPLSPESPWLLVLLAALVALGPLSIDMYLPALPDMRTALNTDVAGMHLTLSTYLAGFAIFHLACGPLADRYGRKPILIIGTVLFVLGCLGCSQSESLEELLMFRFLQGLGACVGPTLARTITRDIFGPTRAARALSLIAMMMALAPAVAPSMGGLLLLVLPWNSIFYFLALYGAVTLVLINLYLAESLPERQSLRPRVIARNYWQLILDKNFMMTITASGLIYAGLIGYLASSSFVFIEMLGVPQALFGLVFMSTVIGYICGSALSARQAGYHSSAQLMKAGTITIVGGLLLALCTNALLPQSVLALALPMMLYSLGMGLTLPHAVTLALQPFPHMAGTASALLGFVQMTLSAMASAFTGYLLTDSPRPMLWIMILVALSSLLLTLRVTNNVRVNA